MKLRLSSSALSLLLGILPFISCKNSNTNPNLDLASIDFLRGDITLCGDAFGELNYSLACNYETRKDFDFGMALLHSFQYAEAEKAFVKVMDKDPNCAMAYWGVAMSIYHAAWFPPNEKQLAKGLKIIQECRKLDMDEKQSGYVNAIGAFYDDWENIPHQKRAKNFEEKMAEMHKKYSEDVEAAVFYCLALYSTRDRSSQEHTNEIKAGAILEELFKSNPNHPGIAHYIIHNYDNPKLASKALETARKYAQIAPASAHAQHMPSHIFTRLGLWDESIKSNLASAESARCYAESEGMDGAYFEEYHALDYLIYAYLQKGDNINAEKEFEKIKGTEKVYPVMEIAVAYPMSIIPARLALENKDWKRAAELELEKSELDWNKFAWPKSIHHFAKAMGAINQKDFKLAKSQIDLIQEQKDKLVAQNNPVLAIQIKQIDIMIKSAQGWKMNKEGDQKGGLAQMQAAVELERGTQPHGITPGDVKPAIELLGDMLMDMGKYNEALAAYEENLESCPNRFNGIYGAAIASFKASDNGKDDALKQKSLGYYKTLLKLSENTNSNRPEVNEAMQMVRPAQAHIN